MIRVKSYQVGPDSPRNPLGGREADGFGKWLTATYAQMRDVAHQMSRADDDSVPARLMRDASEHYGRVRHQWLRVEGQAWEHSRDAFEVMLITDVMTGHAMATYAQKQFRAGLQPEPDKRAWAQMSAEYLRACIILSQYAGVKQADVTDCGDDQGELSALRGRREGE